MRRPEYVAARKALAAAEAWDDMRAEFGQLLGVWRQAAGLTLTQVAAKMELSEVAIHKVETGKLLPSVEFIRKWLKKFAPGCQPWRRKPYKPSKEEQWLLDHDKELCAPWRY